MDITIRHRDVWGLLHMRLIELDFDSSYPTNGEAVNLDLIELVDVKAVIFCDSRLGYSFEWDDANSKVKVYVEEAVAAGGPLLEVANTTDLSALTNVMAIFLGTN